MANNSTVYCELDFSNNGKNAKNDNVIYSTLKFDDDIIAEKPKPKKMSHHEYDNIKPYSQSQPHSQQSQQPQPTQFDEEKEYVIESEIETSSGFYTWLYVINYYISPIRNFKRCKKACSNSISRMSNLMRINHIRNNRNNRNNNRNKKKSVDNSDNAYAELVNGRKNKITTV
jgi:hypothetical protein